MKRNENRRPADCHPERPNEARGLCKSCYNAVGSSRPARCHPGRGHYAHGLCRGCYHKNDKRRRPALCHPDRPAQGHGLCRACYSRAAAYGLPAGRYDEMVAEQGGACAVCGSVPDKLHVDHDHATGQIRSLLCSPCNTALGLFGESPDTLKSAIEYLGRWAQRENYFRFVSPLRV